MSIKLVEAKNPVWGNAENTSVVVECNFEHLPEEFVPFRAIANDVEKHGKEIFACAIAGDFGPIAPYVAPPPVIPNVVTMRQAKLALLQQNLLNSINTAIDQAGEAAKIEWQYATEVKRNNALVQAISAQLNLTEQQIDELFTLAASL